MKCYRRCFSQPNPIEAQMPGATRRLTCRPYVLAVFVSFVVILLGFASNASAAEESHIAGRVTDATTHAGIEGVEVCARLRSEGFGGHCANTDRNGEYTITEVPTGSYVVQFVVPFQSYLDYASQYYDDKVSQTEAEEVTVMAGEAARGIDAAMQPGGKITGVVTDTVTHDPIAGVEACAFRPREASRCDVTNSDGEYTIEPLVGGEYMVVFRAPSNGPLDYAPLYYDDQASFEQANEVAVTAGETTTGIDVAMQPGGNITGQVTVAATGSPLMNASVCGFSLAALSIGNETPEDCVQTNARGEYTLSRLNAGQDVVEFYDEFGAGFVRQYYDGVSSRAEATPLPATPGVTITGVDAALRAVGEETVKPPSLAETRLSTNRAPATPLIEAAPFVTLATSKLVASKGSAQVRLTCSRAACQGSIELVAQVVAHGRDGRTMTGKTAMRKTAVRRKTIVFATGSFSLADGQSGSILLRLTPAGRRWLARAQRHPMAARLVLAVKGGGTVSRVVGVE